MSTIGLFNPIPRALEHAQLETTDVIRALRHNVQIVDIPVHSAERGGDRRGRTLLKRAAQLQLDRLRASSASYDVIVVLWPAFANWEVAAWPRLRKDGPPVLIIHHDPTPLRHQFGTGRISSSLSARLARLSNVRLVVLSEAAEVVVTRDLGWKRPARALHPIMIREDSATATVPTGDVVVCGQWKPSRDLSLLADLGRELAKIGERGRIYGCGWPEIPGWTVDSRFLTESELKHVIATAGCVVLPYAWYFQSGIAVRALESHVPVVGTDHPFLRELYGDDWQGLVQRDGGTRAWLDAVERSLNERGSTQQLLQKYRCRTLDSWDQLLASAGV